MNNSSHNFPNEMPSDASEQGTIPVLLDTDIGTDIDDALALTYLLRQPRAELLGVTTATGEAHLRAELADAVCRSLGREDVPIHVGHAEPMSGEVQQKTAAQAAGLSPSWPRRRFDAQPTAVEFLMETINARPGEITLLCIGPMTNIGEMLVRDPSIAQKLKRIVLMGGQITGFWPGQETWGETNIRCDAQAADIVFHSGAPTAMVGYEITMQCGRSASKFYEALQPQFPLLADLAAQWQSDHAIIHAHDPLAAALIFEPCLCRWERGNAGVERRDPSRLGMTPWRPDDGGRHLAASAVDAPAFFDHFFSTLTANQT